MKKSASVVIRKQNMMGSPLPMTVRTDASLQKMGRVGFVPANDSIPRVTLYIVPYNVGIQTGSDYLSSYIAAIRFLVK